MHPNLAESFSITLMTQSALLKQKYKSLLSVLKYKNHLWEYSPEIQAKQEQ